MIPRLTLILIVALGASGLTACASYRTDPRTFEAGVAAYDAGDYAKAYRIWAPLAERDDLAAQRNVAHLLRRGLGVKRNLRRAFHYYKEAAQHGLVGAQINLAFLYLKGQGTRRNVRKAVYWFERAARNGSAEAQFQLAHMLETGEGLKRNWNKAVIYYLAAAGQGHKGAMYQLGRMKVIAEGMKGLTPLTQPDTGKTKKLRTKPLLGGTSAIPNLGR